MRTKRRGPWRVPSFEALMERAYGVDDQRLLRPPQSAERLLERYYGYQPKAKYKNGCAPRCTVHVDCDDATHTLAQRKKTNGHLAPAPAKSPPAPSPTAAPPPLAQPAPAPQPAAAPAPRAAAPADVAPGETMPAADATAGVAPAPVPNGAVGVPADSGLTKRLETSPGDTTASEDDFISDMKSILDGTGAYDKKTKKVVARDKLKESGREESRAQSTDNANGLGDGGNGQAIFDRIARSMKYAGAYDLGEVELENRFADFDRMDDLRNKPKQPARKAGREYREPPPVVDIPPVGNAEFIEDLEAIQKQSVDQAEALRDASIDIANAMKPELSNPASVPAKYAEPFYGAGEHARSAGDLYKDKLLVGKAPGAVFSYGELIAMADLFDNVDQMMAEDPALLKSLRALIQREIAGGDVSTTEWMNASRDRYIRLAEDNHEHYSPNLFFQPKKLPSTLKHRNHRTEWEAHHKRAIQEAQKAAGGKPFPANSDIPMQALIINGYGDHFLTDAFAAGHVVNRQEITELFKSRFYTGGKLSEDANAFFDKVAKEAWHGSVASKFSKLETFEPYDAWWNIVNWNPNINSASRFASVLKEVAQAKPDKIANLALKAVHDHYNKLGIEVTNGAGQAPWKLTGDGHLTEETRKIMELAVRESAAHITDPDLVSGKGKPLTDYFERVWKHVPVLTAKSTDTVRLFVDGYIKPDHPVLAGKAAALIHAEVDTLIKQLLDAKALKPA